MIRRVLARDMWYRQQTSGRHSCRFTCPPIGTPKFPLRACNFLLWLKAWRREWDWTISLNVEKAALGLFFHEDKLKTSRLATFGIARLSRMLSISLQSCTGVPNLRVPWACPYILAIRTYKLKPVYRVYGCPSTWQCCFEWECFLVSASNAGYALLCKRPSSKRFCDLLTDILLAPQLYSILLAASICSIAVESKLGHSTSTLAFGSVCMRRGPESDWVSLSLLTHMSVLALFNIQDTPV